MSKKYYVTKFALRNGIQVLHGSPPDESGHTITSWGSLKVGRDAFTNRIDAIKDANMRRDKRARALERELKFLSKLKFKVEEPHE